MKCEVDRKFKRIREAQKVRGFLMNFGVGFIRKQKFIRIGLNLM